MERRQPEVMCESLRPFFTSQYFEELFGAFPHERELLYRRPNTSVVPEEGMKLAQCSASMPTAPKSVLLRKNRKRWTRLVKRVRWEGKGWPPDNLANKLKLPGPSVNNLSLSLAPGALKRGRRCEAGNGETQSQMHGEKTTSQPLAWREETGADQSPACLLNRERRIDTLSGDTDKISR
jgi:hypothetical protein